MKMIAGALLLRDLEQAPDARRAEAGEHLDERARRLAEEVGAGLAGDRLREQRLAGAGRAVQQDALRHGRAEPLEALRRREGTRPPRAARPWPPRSRRRRPSRSSSEDSGLICCGFVRGIILSVRQTRKTSATISRIGSQVKAQLSTRSIEVNANGKASVPPALRALTDRRSVNEDNSRMRPDCAPNLSPRTASTTTSSMRSFGEYSPPDLRARLALDHHDVGREVVLAPDQAGADAVDVDRHALALELADPLGVEAAGDDDPARAGGRPRRARRARAARARG